MRNVVSSPPACVSIPNGVSARSCRAVCGVPPTAHGPSELLHKRQLQSRSLSLSWPTPRVHGACHRGDCTARHPCVGEFGTETERVSPSPSFFLSPRPGEEPLSIPLAGSVPPTRPLSFGCFPPPALTSLLHAAPLCQLPPSFPYIVLAVPSAQCHCRLAPSGLRSVYCPRCPRRSVSLRVGAVWSALSISSSLSPALSVTAGWRRRVCTPCCCSLCPLRCPCRP